jgi:hypothetical protein
MMRGLFKRDFDWEHPDDYAPEGAEWHDATVVGSVYQQQNDMANLDRWRHRHVPSTGEWMRGPDPSLGKGSS